MYGDNICRIISFTFTFSQHKLPFHPDVLPEGTLRLPTRLRCSRFQSQWLALLPLSLSRYAANIMTSYFIMTLHKGVKVIKEVFLIIISHTPTLRASYVPCLPSCGWEIKFHYVGLCNFQICSLFPINCSQLQ